MNKILIALVLGFAMAAAGQDAAQPAQGQPAAAPSQGPVIKDPAEYNAYVGATGQKDAPAKISGLEAFLTQYPNSVMKVQALELLMGAYQQTGNQAKTVDAAQRLLQADASNVRALALLAYLKRASALAGGPNAQADLAAAKDYGQKGLQALDKFTKPEGTSDADFQKMKDQMSGIFNSAVGSGCLQDKDYPCATKALKAASDANPTDFSLVYPLALAYLQSTPPDYINGIWYAARASVVAPNPQYQQQIEKYAKSQYVKYHAGDDGWADVLAAAKANTSQPAGFTIAPAPTPAEQAHKMATAQAPEKMDFATWEFVLSNGNQEDKDLVWNAIKDKALQMNGQVIKATATQFDIAGSQDDIDQKRADIILTFEATVPARLIPKPGTSLDFQGNPTSYIPSPFVMNMEKGVLLTKAQPKPKPRTPVHHRPAN